MTSSAAAAALDRMESDEAFAQRVKEAGGPDASIELLKGEGFDVTPDDMRDAVLDRYGDQLTTEQLDALAAGLSTDEFGRAAMVFTGTWIGISAAAAVAAVV